MTGVLGLDIGSQSVKAVCLDERGNVAASASAALTMSHPAPGWAEQSPIEWVDCVTRCVRKVLSRVSFEISTLAVAAQVDAVVALDSNLRPLGPALIWLDRRSTSQLDAFVDRVGAERLFTTTGLNADASHAAPKMMWQRENDPDAWAATRWLVPVAGYLLAWLTAEIAQDPANASSTMLFDVTEGAYSESLCAAADISLAMLPRIAPATEVVGKLTPGAANQLGLPAGCQVVVGTGDEHAACLAAGATSPGIVVDVAGTAEVVGAPCAMPVFDETRLVETHRHAVGDLYLVENPGFVAGGSTAWLAAQILNVPQAQVFDLAAQAPRGSDEVLFVPALSGSTTPRWHSDMRAAFSGLSLTHSGAHLARAVLEGCAYGLRDIVDRLDAMGLVGGEVRIVGGGSRSDLWNQIKADVLGRPVRRVRTEHGTAVGAAMLAGVAAGLFSDLAVAADECIDLCDPVEPDPRRQAAYEGDYGRYRDLFAALEPPPRSRGEAR